MEVKDGLRTSLKALEEFVQMAKAEAGRDPVDVEGKDAAFLAEAKAAVESGEVVDLRTLAEEMRGLSHYFCSYTKDTRTLDSLIDDLFSSLQKAIHG